MTKKEKNDVVKEFCQRRAAYLIDNHFKNGEFDFGNTAFLVGLKGEYKLAMLSIKNLLEICEKLKTIIEEEYPKISS